MEGRFADAVIVAAGASRRMGGTDKLEAPLLGRPLLAWSVEAVARAETVRRLVVVAAPDRVKALSGERYIAEHAATVVAGGAERIDSVRNGVAAADAEVVLVHDAARPLVTSSLVDAVAKAAAEQGAAIPVVPVADSLKRSDGTAVERTGLQRAQTPQAALRALLLRAFDATAGRPYTDEAALLEAAGIPVTTVEGDPANMKVTQPADLELVRAIAAGRAGEQRIGFGNDTHPFGPGEPLRLGGLTIDGAPGLFGHSDGDVVLHAVTTAILSAAGLGDIGRAFPADDRTPPGVPSTDLLAEAIRRAADAGYRATSLSVAILGARPRLGAARLDGMRVRIAELLGVGQEVVSVSASSGNLSGDEGAGRSISATAVAAMVRR